MSREDLRQLIVNDIKAAHLQNADKAEAIADHLLAFDFMRDEGTVAAFMDSYRKAMVKRESGRGLAG